MKCRNIHGGSFSNATNFVRCTIRYKNHPLNRYVDLGFRVVNNSLKNTTKADNAMRGGSWNSSGRRVRSVHRIRYLPNYHNNYIGFRIVGENYEVVNTKSTVRGGSWFGYNGGGRSAFRCQEYINGYNDIIGFRIIGEKL